VTTANAIVENYPDEPLLFADGFEDALMGVVTIFNSVHVCYDYAKCIAVLYAQGMTYEEAEEFFSFNVSGAYVGENTPAFFYRPCSFGD
jgi:hypothetical protein